MDAGLSAIDIDPNFEPQIRARSNTWPCRPVEDFADGQQASPASDDPGVNDHSKDALGIKQKTSSRRNAWGNLSYADLITKAIQSSPEQRLTLSQIYDWMVQNVPYFKDKGDNTSSAGWKNSIRHNLSLHSRFMRIQNEGTGKSSWWVINPDAKPGKAPRRRAGSMETKSLEKKRGRIKKRIEAIRAAQENGTLTSEDFPEYHYNSSLSPEFRGRAGSNASSCGRLSPIQAAVEPDLHDSQVPPMSPIPWGTELEADDFVNTNSSESFSLVDSLVGGLNLKESGNLAGDQNDVEMNTLKQQLMSGGSLIRYNTPNNFDESSYGSLPAPPSYTDHLQQQQNSQRTVLNMDSMAVQNRNFSPKQPMEVYQDNIMGSQMMPSPNMPSPSSNSLGINVSPQMNSPARSPQLSPSNYQSAAYSPQPMKRSPQQQQQQQQQQQLMNQQQQQLGNRSLLQQCLEAPTDSMLRQALTQHMKPSNTYQTQSSPPPQQQQQQLPSQYMQQFPAYSRASIQNLGPGLNNINNNITMVPQSNRAPIPQMVNMGQQQQQMPPTNMSTNSLAEIDTENMLDLDYDYEQLFRQELALDPSLDFNFDSNSSTQNVPTSDNQNLVR